MVHLIIYNVSLGINGFERKVLLFVEVFDKIQVVHIVHNVLFKIKIVSVILFNVLENNIEVNIILAFEDRNYRI